MLARDAAGDYAGNAIAAQAAAQGLILRHHCDDHALVSGQRRRAIVRAFQNRVDRLTRLGIRWDLE